MQKILIRRKFAAADVVVVALLATVIYALVAFGREFHAAYRAAYDIDLSLYSLPYYTLFSALRGMAAFAFSLAFTLVIGYWAAKSAKAERVLIPLLDILQSIPVLGFLPGLVLVLIALFPATNTGLELACIIMIFTGQVWNMTFSFYSSLKSVPTDFNEVTSVIGLSPWEKLRKVELPFSAMNLVWNSLLSMSGGWFFLSVCEAFTLGNQEYRLPGIGAYMATAIGRGNTTAMISGIVAMTILVVVMDILIWRPVLAWAHQFRLEETPGYRTTEPLMRNLVRESGLLRWLRINYRRKILHRSLLRTPIASARVSEGKLDPRRFMRSKPNQNPILTWGGRALLAVLLSVVAYGTIRLAMTLSHVPCDCLARASFRNQPHVAARHRMSDSGIVLDSTCWNLDWDIATQNSFCTTHHSGAGVVSRSDALSAGSGGDVCFENPIRAGRHVSDAARRTVVHPVQCSCRSHENSRRTEIRGAAHEHSKDGDVEETLSAQCVSGTGDRMGHRRWRRLERQYRRGVFVL